MRVPAEPDAQSLPPRFRDRSEAVDGLLRHDGNVDRLRFARTWHGFEACQPEEIIDEMAHSLAFTVDLLEGAPVPVGISR